MRRSPKLAESVRDALQRSGIALPSLACLLANERDMADPVLHEAAAALAVPLRFAAAQGSLAQLALQAVPQSSPIAIGKHVAIAVADQPLDIASIGLPRGRLAVIGLGPGAADLMVPAVKAELARANDVLGYETYVRMAGPFRADQVLHCTDNREEMQRARHAFELAAQGRSVVVVSSGDPGVFAMAAAVLEALHESTDPRWHAVELEMLPGVSASLATAAQAGAPLGHDFCVLSLSDNLKPWAIIEKRLDLACEADLALAFLQPDFPLAPMAIGQGPGHRSPASRPHYPHRSRARHRPARPDPARHHLGRVDPRAGGHAHHGPGGFLHHLHLRQGRRRHLGLYPTLVRQQTLIAESCEGRRLFVL